MNIYILDSKITVSDWFFFMKGTSKGTKKSVTLPYEDTKGQKKGNYYCILYLFIFCLTAMQGDGG